MCLNVDLELTERKAKEYLTKGTEKITFFKRLDIFIDKLKNNKYKLSVCTPCQVISIKKYGRQEATGKLTNILNNTSSIYGGAIHMFSLGKYSYNIYRIIATNSFCGQVLIPVQVNTKDIIAFGKGFNEVAVKRYIILKETWDTLINDVIKYCDGLN
jgi:hypothetical protein